DGDAESCAQFASLAQVGQPSMTPPWYGVKAFRIGHAQLWHGLEGAEDAGNPLAAAEQRADQVASPAALLVAGVQRFFGMHMANKVQRENLLVEGQQHRRQVTAAV